MPTDTRYPVSVLVEEHEVARSGWSVWHSEVTGVVAAPVGAPNAVERRLVHQDETGKKYLWSGLELELFKDSAEAYWYNLTAMKPSLYVVCQAEDDEPMKPFLVTANHDEAGAYAEADGDEMVFPVPMPPDIHQWLERYVVENYVPEQKKKRKRKDWKGEDRKP